MFINFKNKEDLLSQALSSIIIYKMTEERQFETDEEYLQFITSQADSLKAMSLDDLCHIYDLLCVSVNSTSIN